MAAHAPARPVRRTRVIRPVVLVAAALLIAAVSYAVPRSASRPASGPTPVGVALPGVGAGELGVEPLTRVDAAIGTWTANLERDQSDFIAATYLSELYLARARLTGLAGDYDRALDAADRALSVNPLLLTGRALRAQILFASHDFVGAESEATALLAEYPDLPQALATLGDARLELGDYAGATAAYRQLASGVVSPAVTARQARLSAVTGSLDEARDLAEAALAAALADAELSAPDRSWYHVLDGALAFQSGDLAAAETAYRAALEAWPRSPQASAGLGRVLAADGRLAEAIVAYERSVTASPQPETLGTLGDLLTLAGSEDEAETRYTQVRGIGAIESEAGLYNRALVLFMANHGESPERAVELAALELEQRTDVYGWDAYAWALHVAGRSAEADAAMERALAHGTQDALLDYHAGMIAAAVGRPTEAAGLLRSALDRNPGFDVLQAARAAETLAQLEMDR